MKLKVFTLRMKPETGMFEDQELSEFQLGKDVIELSEHFMVHEKTPTLVLVLRYREIQDGGHPSSEAPRKDWRAELDAQGQKIYDELRLWRGRKAKREGMPPYLILNNRELAQLAMRRPASLARLREIDGIGEAKSERWGEEMLALLAKLSAQAPGSGAPAQAAQPPDAPKNAGGGNSWPPSSFPFSSTGRKRSGIFSPALRGFPSGCASPFPRA